MKLTKFSLSKKYSFFLRDSKVLKKINKYWKKSKLKLKQPANRLLSFVLVAQESRSLCKLNRDKNFLRNKGISIYLEKSSLISKEQDSSKKERVKYVNALGLIKITPIFFNLKKDISLTKWQYYKQFFFILKELIESFDKSNLFFLRESSTLLSSSDFNGLSLETKSYNLFKNAMVQFFFKEKTGVFFKWNKSYLNTLYFKELHKYTIYIAFLALVANLGGANENFKVKKAINLFIAGLTLETTFWEATGVSKVLSVKKYNTMSFVNTYMKQKKVITMTRRRSSSLVKPQLFMQTTSSKQLSLAIRNYIWKRNNSFFVKGTPTEITKVAQVLNKKLKYSLRKTSIQLLYILARLEEKLEEIEQQDESKLKETTKQNLLLLQGLLVHHLREKKERAIKNNLLVAPRDLVFKSRRKAWKQNLLKSILSFINKPEQVKNKKYQKFINNLYKQLTKQKGKRQKHSKLGRNLNKNKGIKLLRLVLNERKRRATVLAKLKIEKLKEIRLKKSYSKQPKNFQRLIRSRLATLRKSIRAVQKPNFFKQRTQKNQRNQRNNRFMFKTKLLKKVGSPFTSTPTSKGWQKARFSVRRTWVGTKSVSVGKYTTFLQKKQLLSTWAERPIDLFFVNALSLSKFAFKLERIENPQNKPNRFLSIIERDFINKYKYVAIYIKDLVRIGFISMFLKKPSFLAKFAAFQLAKLPRNRKETVFIRFLIKAIRTFAAGRKEILALRVKIKGRVNRWRRTKYIVGTRGTLPLQTISERIEQGTAQAINRKGAVGIRIWVRYKPSFMYRLNNHILTYMRYSGLVKVKRKRKAIILK